MLTKTPILLSLCFCLLTACGNEVTIESLADANSNTQFKVNPLANIPTNNAPTASIPVDAMPTPAPYPSLTAASADTSNAVDKTFILQAIAVEKNTISNYERGSGETNWNNANIEQIVTLANANSPLDGSTSSTSPVLSLSFNAGGDIAAVTIYFADKIYQSSTNSPISDEVLIGTIGSGADDDATTTAITVDRKNIFGITYNNNSIASDYMVYVNWNLAKEAHSLASNGTQDSIFADDGVMIAGMETDGSNIPLIGEATFNGKGRGKYGDKKGTYTTIFDMVAKINFTNSIEISSENTMRCENNSSQFSDCTQIEEATLDFSGLTTNIIQQISGGLVATDLFGRFNARFYGSKAEELGGTFEMVSSGSDRYYYGAFGGKRGNIFIAGGNQFTINEFAPITSNPQATSIPVDAMSTPMPYTSLTAASADTMNAVDKPFTLQGLAIHKEGDITYNRVAIDASWDDSNIAQTVKFSNIASPALLLSFDAAGNMSALTAYFDDKTYIADISGGTPSATNISGVIDGNSIGVADDATTTKLMAGRSKDIFGYNLTANYMLYVDWLVEKARGNDGLTQSSYRNHGMMMTGMETSAMIPATGTLVFEGKGRGFYGDANNDYATIFNMIANIDLATPTISLQILNTMSCVGEPDISTCNIPASALDFSATALSFVDGNNTPTNTATNAISGDVAFFTADVDGTVNARFYGGTIGIKEFGGTFAFANSSRYYYGAFGGYDFGFPNVVSVGAMGNLRPMNNDLGSYKSFDAVSAVVTLTLPAVAVQYTSIVTPASATLQRIAGVGNESPAITVTFDAMGNITNARTYFADQSYSLTPTTAEAKKISHDNAVNDITAEVTLISMATNFDLTLTRENNAPIYGFEPQYAMIGWWRIENAGGDRNDGNIVTGFETANTGPDGIPIVDDNATFSGGSIGVYNSDTTSENFQTISTVTVDVNFAMRTVGVTSNATKSCVTISNCTTDKSDLNFKTGDDAIAKYAIGENNISGAITSDNSEMKGRFDARFYGDAAKEMGGTFIMESADKDKYYMGAFITRRP